MSAPADTRLKGRTRWSMTARCPRQAAYAFFGAEPAPLDEEVILYMERGKLDQQWFVEQILEPQHGRENLEIEKAIPWPATGMPIGELHTDVFLKPQALPIEVKSHADGQASDDDLVQLAGEIHFDPDANGAGTLVVIDRNLRRHYKPLVLEDAPELVEEVEQRAAQVVQATRTGELPPRVCRKPGDARGKLCPFAQVCFEGWEKPETPRVETKTVIDLARQLYQIDRISRQVKGNSVDKQAALEKMAAEGIDAAIAHVEASPTGQAVDVVAKEIKARLAEAVGQAPEDFLRDPGEYEVGPLTLIRTHVSRRGYEVAPSEYDTWKVRREGDAPLLDPDDFGAVPF